MNKLKGRLASALIIVMLIAIILTASGCTASASEGFAIYLSRGNTPPSEMESLSHVNIADQPLISLSDIISYDAGTHKITLTADAYNRISKLEVPVSGKSFVVCVDKHPVYWGAFWTTLSSASFDGVVIEVPLALQEPNVIRIGLGYPSSSFYRGEDPRNNPEVINSLKQAGKLSLTPSASAAGNLPRSMKGYELYSWLENSQWHFTLITGTNRNKTLAEVTAESNEVSDEGWVQIQVTGVDALKGVLSRVPQSEQIFWAADLKSEATPPVGLNITLPPEEILKSIQEYAGQNNINLVIPAVP